MPPDAQHASLGSPHRPPPLTETSSSTCVRFFTRFFPISGGLFLHVMNFFLFSGPGIKCESEPEPESESDLDTEERRQAMPVIEL